MSALNPAIETSLRLAAGAQLVLALVNLALVRLMKWKPEIDRMPLLLREVFQVHLWFISITLTIFGMLTWQFAAEIAAGAHPLCSWLAAAIGAFWGIRTVLQITYYSSSHWRGNAGRTWIHAGCLVFYGSLAVTYLLAALGSS